MRKSILIMVLLITTVMTAACTMGDKSSMEETSYVISQLPDYQLTIEKIKVTSFGIGIHKVIAEKTSPKIEFTTSIFNNIIIYKTKTNRIKMCFLDDSRPPKIIATKELN